MQRKAKARWQGNLKAGSGALSTESGTLSETPYTFRMRFDRDRGTNPEELIAAAHAGCFSMQMSAELEKRRLVCDFIEVEAAVTLEKTGEIWSISKVHLDVLADIPGASSEVVEEAANDAKKNCIVSRLLNAEISMDFKFQPKAMAV